MTLDELLARVVRSISTTKTFSLENVREFIVSQGEFIYNQLIGLDDTSKENEQTFRDLPMLTALRDENKKQGNLVPLEDSSSLNFHHSSLITHHFKIPHPFGTITHLPSLNIFHTVCGPHICHSMQLFFSPEPRNPNPVKKKKVRTPETEPKRRKGKKKERK